MGRLWPGLNLRNSVDKLWPGLEPRLSIPDFVSQTPTKTLGMKLELLRTVKPYFSMTPKQPIFEVEGYIQVM